MKCRPLMAWMAILASGATAADQAATQGSVFEVASFKQSRPPDTGVRVHPSIRMGAMRVDLQNVDLRRIITLAYEVRTDQVMGPDWIVSELYDITATMPKD